MDGAPGACFYEGGGGPGWALKKYFSRGVKGWLETWGDGKSTREGHHKKNRATGWEIGWIVEGSP